MDRYFFLLDLGFRELFLCKRSHWAQFLETLSVGVLFEPRAAKAFYSFSCLFVSIQKLKFLGFFGTVMSLELLPFRTDLSLKEEHYEFVTSEDLWHREGHASYICNHLGCT